MATSQTQAHPAASLYSLLSPGPRASTETSPRHPNAAASMAALPKISAHGTSGVDTRAGFHAFAPSISTHSAALPVSASVSSSVMASTSAGAGAGVRVRVGPPPALGEAREGGKEGVLSSRSPSSPASFFTQPEAQYGLNHLLEAAEQVRPSVHDLGFYRHDGRASPNKRPFSMGPLPSLASKMSAIGGYSTMETPRQPLPPHQHQQIGPKRSRVDSDVSMDMHPSYRVLPNVPRQTMVYPSFSSQDISQQAQHQHASFHQQQQQQHHHHHQQQHQQQHLGQPRVTHRVPREEVLSPCSTGGASPAGNFGRAGRRGVEPPQMVWETVLATGKFPEDVCLSEHNHNSSQSPVLKGASGDDLQLESIKAGRWSGDEKQFAEALMQSVRSGEAALPPNTTLHQFIADSLQRRAAHASTNLESLKLEDSQQESSDSDVSQRAESFNALSLKSIMNNDAGEAETASASATHPQLARQDSSSSKKSARVLKRSDYSQHRVVRSGRWSVEEENYARAMIEAFKSGYLPLHGNVSLRKFLSEVLVCHPMRISKKFVGYVRKYHWYRIAAGKCDPEARRQSLQTLSHLERVFWTSLQQSNEWTHGGYQQQV